MQDTAQDAVPTSPRDELLRLLQFSRYGETLDMVLDAIRHKVSLAYVTRAGRVFIIEPARVATTAKGHLKVFGTDAWSQKPIRCRIDRMGDATSVPPKGGWPETMRGPVANKEG